MSEVRKMAEKLFNTVTSPIFYPYAPNAVRPKWDDLQPCDQEHYIRMAKVALGVKS